MCSSDLTFPAWAVEVDGVLAGRASIGRAKRRGDAELVVVLGRNFLGRKLGRALAAMLIQTDKFGTSVARSLRVHSDCLRTERIQRAEEAAAKTTIKLIFPLLFCIFPALLVVILGPAFLNLAQILGETVQKTAQ